MAVARERESANGNVPLREHTLPVFRVRDLPLEPLHGEDGAMHWRQYTETVQLRLPLIGADWEAVTEGEFEVKVSPTQIVVKCQGRCKDSILEPLSGKLKKEINPKRCWFALEGDFREPFGKTRVLVVELAKKTAGKPWPAESIFKNELFNRKSFNWTIQQQGEAEQGDITGWVTLKPGRRPDLEDPFVTSRGWLCTEFEQGQTDEVFNIRIVLDQKTLDRCLEKVPYYRLFAVDCSEKYFKLFIRGDESSPVLMGELEGRTIPDATFVELTELVREVEGHRISGTMETLPCFDVTLVKAPDSQFAWGDLIISDGETLNQPQGSLEEFEEQQLRQQREPSPDREEWTPDDWADEQKLKADTEFKAGNFRDAVVYYTRALRFTPRSEKLLSNRSAGYLKISKFQFALDDIMQAQEIEPNWTKLYFRKGQALRGLKRFKDATAAFREGEELDMENPEWKREIQRTNDTEKAILSRKASNNR